MAQNFDDLNLPNAVVTRIAKEVLPENVAVAKEARTALAKAASVFVLYITSASNASAIKNNRKTVNGSDVIQAMEETDFLMFVGRLQESLESFRKLKKEKKEANSKKNQEKAALNAVNESNNETENDNDKSDLNA